MVIRLCFCWVAFYLVVFVIYSRRFVFSLDRGWGYLELVGYFCCDGVGEWVICVLGYFFGEAFFLGVCFVMNLDICCNV